MPINALINALKKGAWFRKRTTIMEAKVLQLTKNFFILCVVTATATHSTLDLLKRRTQSKGIAAKYGKKFPPLDHNRAK